MKKLKYSLLVCSLLCATFSYAKSEMAANAEVAQAVADAKQNASQHQVADDPCAGIENCTVAVSCDDDPEADACNEGPLASETQAADDAVATVDEEDN